MNEQQINDEYTRQLYMVLYGPESWSPTNPKPEYMMEITQDMVNCFRSYVEDPRLATNQEKKRQNDAEIDMKIAYHALKRAFGEKESSKQ